MRWKRPLPVLAVICCLVIAAFVSDASLSAASSDSSVKINLGNRTLTFPAGTKPDIAMFAGSGIAYQTAYQHEVPVLEKKDGISITYFDDATFSPTTQLAEMRSALQNKKFNAWIVENYAGVASCTLETKQAPAAKIVVSTISDPTCNAATEPFGTTYWSPGTLNSVGAHSSVTYYTGWMREAKSLFGTAKPQVAVLNGPPLVAATENMDTALKANKITTIANVNTDYTLPTALKEFADLLQAHPNINVVFAVGPDVATGIVDALKAAGKKAGQVKIFDVGGASTDVTLIKEGWLTMTVPYFPVTALDSAVTNLIDAFDGHQGPRAVPGLAEGTPSSPFEVDKSTLSQYRAQY